MSQPDSRVSIGEALDVALRGHSAALDGHDSQISRLEARCAEIERIVHGFADRMAAMGAELASQMVQLAEAQQAIGLLQRR